MSDGAKFSLAQLTRARKTGPGEIGILLNLHPSAILIVEIRSLKIMLANLKACDLSGYQPNELAGLNLKLLFPSWNNNLPGIRPNRDLTPPASKLDLRRKDQSLLPASIQNMAFSSDGETIYLVFDQYIARENYRTNPKDQSLPEWSELLETLLATEIQTALDQILPAMQCFTGAGILAIYAADVNDSSVPQGQPSAAKPPFTSQPSFVCVAHYGDPAILPNRLSAQDFTSLKSPQLWQSGKRPTTTLQRIAQANKLSFIASIPLGAPKQPFGLVALADEKEPARDGLLQDGQSFAALISAVIQKTNLTHRYAQLLTDLAGSDNLLNILQKNIIEGSLLLSPELRILGINTAAEKVLGYKDSEVRGQPVESVLIGTDTLITSLKEIRQMGTTLADGDSLNQSGQPQKSTLDARLYRRSGEAFLAHIHASPVLSEGKLTSILVLFQDLSEQERIREQTSQLEQRAILGEITAVFAHEVRNPINNLSTGLELLSSNLAADDPNQATVARMLQDCDRLAELMKSVLSYARPTEYTMSRMQLEPFLQNLMERMRPRMEQVNVRGSLQIEPGCPPVMGSLRALEQVFVNLMTNAIQAMSETGGQLILKVQLAQDIDLPPGVDHTRFVEVSVIDTGPGIPREVQERIFQPFFTTNYSGTGLGLAITKRILTAHRGYIRLTSFPGGAVFRVLLPASI